MTNKNLPPDLLDDQEEMKLIYGGVTPLDVLIAIQEFMDQINLFAYQNWLEGTIVEGPYIEKYWIELTAMYEYNQMPDPSAGMRLIKRGCKVKFWEDEIEVPQTTKRDDYNAQASPEQKRTDKKKKKIWMVTMRVPRHLIDGMLEKLKEPIY